MREREEWKCDSILDLNTLTYLFFCDLSIAAEDEVGSVSSLVEFDEHVPRPTPAGQQFLAPVGGLLSVQLGIL